MVPAMVPAVVPGTLNLELPTSGARSGAHNMVPKRTMGLHPREMAKTLWAPCPGHRLGHRNIHVPRAPCLGHRLGHRVLGTVLGTVVGTVSWAPSWAPSSAPSWNKTCNCFDMLLMYKLVSLRNDWIMVVLEIMCMMVRMMETQFSGMSRTMAAAIKKYIFLDGSFGQSQAY